MKKIILSTLVIVIISAPLRAEKMRIAVINFKGTGVSQTTADNVSELIRGEMINTGLYLVIERSQMDVILKEQGLQQSGCTDVTCAVQVGKILSAKKILIGTVMDIGGMIVISARIVDVQTGTGEFSEKQSAQSEKEIVNAVILFTQKLTNRISGGIPEYEATSQEDQTFRYDPWMMGMEYQFGTVSMDIGKGQSYLIAMSFSNSYGKKIHFGARLGGIVITGSDNYWNNDFKAGTVLAHDVVAGVAEIQSGLNLRIPSDWFGIKLYGGVGILKGILQTVRYYPYAPIPDTSSYPKQEDISYTTPFCSLSLEVPMSSLGSRFGGPMIQIMILPTPKEVDQKYLLVFNFLAFKHVW